MNGRGTILVTGASGFTGRHACSYFDSIGMKVAALVRKAGDTPEYGETVVCDMTVKEQVYEAIRSVRPDYVLHVAGKNSVPESWTNPIQYIETNMMSTLILLDALRELPHCRILVVGSKLKFDLARTEKPPHPYSWSKTMQQTAARHWMHLFEQHIMLAEPSNLIGPGPSTGICALFASKMIRMERGYKEGPFRLSSAGEQRDFLDVRDAVRAYGFILRAGSRGTVYPIESGIWRRLDDVIEAFQRHASKRVPVIAGNDDVRTEPVPANPALMRELGWTPQISFETSVQDIVDYYRKRQEVK
ncbi:NAD-dependent epimerase/dehydratase family protein [Paenibacillus sp. MSJ-34]|nr:NAD-dependent epimerase/dehydratase family protein [Paenibacillus sp. MSJ-34]MBU5440829.1 NAD-dependent epimerase/dehydratase family protein [Paenibacillus sp. MSJ-34]CAH0118474.1 GDP-6-deoxy-D-mannose reductase [Paenibacillus sp. CECT 9249]